MIEEVAPDLLLEDFGLSVTAGAVSGLGILDQNSEIILGGQVVMVDYTLTCRTELFGNLQYGDTAVIDGNNYVVKHEGLRLGDGLYCVIPLEFVSESSTSTFLVTLDGLRLQTADGSFIVTL